MKQPLGVVSQSDFLGGYFEKQFYSWSNYMKVQYLKKMHNAEIGDVIDVKDYEAKVLIATKVAKVYVEPKKAKAKAESAESE